MPKNDLAPGLLLAAPGLHDPNFEKTVVLLGRSDDDGTLGWILNGKELASVADLLAASDLVSSVTEVPIGPGFARVARQGGPVAPATGWLLYRRLDEALPGEMAIGAELAITGEMKAFADLVKGQGPPDFRLILGCSGWAKGQLEGEIGAGSWLPAPVDAELAFDTPVEAVWDEAYRRVVGMTPGVFQSARGKA